MTGIDPDELAKPGPDPDGGIDLTADEFQAFLAAVRGEKPRYEIREHHDDPDFPLDEVVAHHPRLVLTDAQRRSHQAWLDRLTGTRTSAEQPPEVPVQGSGNSEPPQPAATIQRGTNR